MRFSTGRIACYLVLMLSLWGRSHGLLVRQAGQSSQLKDRIGGGSRNRRTRTSRFMCTIRITTRRPTSLHLTPQLEDEESDDEKEDTDRPKAKNASPRASTAAAIVWPSARRLGVDAVAILLAMEVVGLLSSINSPAFGGWFEPLPSLVVQGGLLTKVLQGWLWNTALWTTALYVWSSVGSIPARASAESKSPRVSLFLPTFGLYAMGRLSGALAVAVLASSDGNPLHVPTTLLAPALLDLYTVGLLLGATRYLWGDD